MYSSVLLVRSSFMVIVTIAFDLAGAASFEGHVAVLILQHALDAALLICIIYLTRNVRSLKDSSPLGPGIVGSIAQTGQSEGPVPSQMGTLIQSQNPLSGSGPPVPVRDVSTYHSDGKCAMVESILSNEVATAYPHLNMTQQQQAGLQAVPQFQPQGQWIFVPHPIPAKDGS